MASSQLGKASDFYEDISEVCVPCSAEGIRLQADRFCVECQGYLCKKCSTHHKVLTATRNHALVSIDDAKKAKPAPTKDKCSYKSSEHTGKSIVNTTKGKNYQRYEFQPNNDILKAGELGKLSSRTENVSQSSEKTRSKSNTEGSSRSKQIQPGTRVFSYNWGDNGTVEHYDSSRGLWLVRFDDGSTSCCSTAELEILEEQ